MPDASWLPESMQAIKYKRWFVLLAASCGTAGVVLALVRLLEKRRQRKHGLRRLKLCFSSDYATSAMREAMTRRGIGEFSNSECQIGDFSRIDWDGLLGSDGCSRRVSCLYVRAGLVRKGMLAHHLTKRQRKAAIALAAGAATGDCANAAALPPNVLPPGVVVDLEDEKDFESLQRQLDKMVASDCAVAARRDGGPQWVAKASNANRGENLFVAYEVAELLDRLRPAALGANGITEWVVQRYIAPPLLLKGRKFHIRAHFLVSGCPLCGTSRAWLHKRLHVALVAAVNYTASNDRFAHLTNHCVQESHPEYDESKQILLLEELDAAVGRPGLAAQVHGSMELAITEALAAIASAPAGFAPLPQCFELFGADFTLEDKGAGAPVGVWLLEINAGPDLGIFGDRLKARCVDLLEDVLRVAVEPYLSVQAPAESSAPEQPFENASRCICNRSVEDSPSEAHGFGDCLWSMPPRTHSSSDELTAFKRRVSIASRWVKSLHEGSGVAVRGAQADTASSQSRSFRD